MKVKNKMVKLAFQEISKTQESASAKSSKVQNKQKISKRIINKMNLRKICSITKSHIKIRNSESGILTKNS